VARQTGIKLHCGPLVGHAEMPGWVAQGGFDNATLLAAVRQHVTTVVQRYRGVCARWDVVSEVLAEDGGLRNSVLSRTTGGDAFVVVAFEAAAAADPDVALHLADYNLEAWANSGSKPAGARRLAASLRRRGLRVNGVTLQSHLGGGGGAPASAAAFRDETLRPFVDAGSDVVVAPLESGAAAAQYALDYAHVVAACAGLPRCVGVGLQRFADLFSRNGQGYKTTPAYTAILNAWGPAPAT
jgi:endo-1,4-beta-xylanase